MIATKGSVDFTSPRRPLPVVDEFAFTSLVPFSNINEIVIFSTNHNPSLTATSSPQVLTQNFQLHSASQLSPLSNHRLGHQISSAPFLAHQAPCQIHCLI